MSEQTNAADDAQEAPAGAARDALRSLADAWHDRCTKALNAALNDPQIQMSDLIAITWELGIIEHISPSNPDVREARRKLGRTLWPDQDDVHLYWRILYGIVAMRSSLEHTQIIGSVAAGAVPLIKALSASGQDRLKRFFPKLKHHPGWPWHAKACDLLIMRTLEELRSRGAAPHDPPLRAGTMGKLDGRRIKVDRILDDGTIWLMPADGDPKTALWLFENDGFRNIEGRKGFCPSRLDATVFTLLKGASA